MKTKTHTKYFTSDNVQVKSVTTLIGQHLGWNKQMLIAWSRIQGLKGKDANKVRDEAGEIGTLAHKYCEAYIKKEKVRLLNLLKNKKKRKISFSLFSRLLYKIISRFSYHSESGHGALEIIF